MRVPWTIRRSNQSILKETNPEYSPEGLIEEGKIKSALESQGNLSQRRECLNQDTKGVWALPATHQDGAERKEHAKVMKGNGLPWWLSGKESDCSAGEAGDVGSLSREEGKEERVGSKQPSLMKHRELQITSPRHKL